MLYEFIGSGNSPIYPSYRFCTFHTLSLRLALKVCGLLSRSRTFGDCCLYKILRYNARSVANFSFIVRSARACICTKHSPVTTVTNGGIIFSYW